MTLKERFACVPKSGKTIHPYDSLMLFNETVLQHRTHTHTHTYSEDISHSLPVFLPLGGLFCWQGVLWQTRPDSESFQILGQKRFVSFRDNLSCAICNCFTSAEYILQQHNNNDVPQKFQWITSHMQHCQRCSVNKSK